MTLAGLKLVKLDLIQGCVGLGAVCCAAWQPAYMNHGCCTTNDDRTRISSDPAEPKSGRYSLKILVRLHIKPYKIWICAEFPYY